MVVLKILQARLQQYMNLELPDVQAGFRKGKGTSDQIASIHCIIGKARTFQRNICFFDHVKGFDCVDHNKLCKILEEMGIPDFTCLLRNLYTCQEATVRTGHGTTDWFKTGKGVHQGYILSLCLLNVNAQYIIQNAAAVAKSLQSCLTLCNPIDGSPPGSAIPGILQARILEWVAISFSNA